MGQSTQTLAFQRDCVCHSPAQRESEIGAVFVTLAAQGLLYGVAD